MNIDEIQNEIEKLSADDRQLLLERLLLGNNATSSKEPMILPTSKDKNGRAKIEGIEGAEITIKDWHGEFRNKPLVIIRHKNGTEKEIDILAMVKENATNIAHPAILLALYRWQEIIRYHHSLTRARFKKPENYDGFRKLAEKHIRRLMSAILEGAKERAIPVEAALYHMMYGWAMHYEYYALKWIWELLDHKTVRTKRNVAVKLETLKALIPEELKSNPPLSKVGLPEALHFLECIGKSRLGKDPEHLGESILRKRPSWFVMRAAFDRWRFGFEEHTLKTYRRKSKYKTALGGIDMRFLRPDLLGDFFISELLTIRLYRGVENNSI